jgi:hypothetical protein
MDIQKQKSGEERTKEQSLVKRFALRGGAPFVVFKDIKISLAFFDSFLGNAKKNETFKLY